jgi:hypothetical protein
MKSKILAWACALSFAGVAGAQTAGVVTLRANQTSATGSMTPVLTWSTNPVATSCRASGGWSGTKAASGTQTLTAINASTNYTLTCTWGSGSAVVNWSAPTTNTNGSALTNLARFRVLYGNSSSSLTQSVTIEDPTRRSATISLAPGTWYFAVRAVNSSNVESDNSNVASKTVNGATAAGTVSITITQPTPTPPPPTPPPPTGLRTIGRDVIDVRLHPDGLYRQRAVVGTIALGKPCFTTFSIAGGWYEVNRTDVALNGIKPASTQLLARCASQ